MRRVLDRPLPRGRHEVGQSAFAFLFSEFIQYSQTRVTTADELQRKLEDAGSGIGRRVLELGVLGERDADRVAQPVGEERADPDRALHPSVLALARLGDAEVERVVPAEAVLLGGEGRGSEELRRIAQKLRRIAPSYAELRRIAGSRRACSAARRRYACTITNGFDAFIEKTKLW